MSAANAQNECGGMRRPLDCLRRFEEQTQTYIGSKYGTHGSGIIIIVTTIIITISTIRCLCVEVISFALYHDDDESKQDANGNDDITGDTATGTITHHSRSDGCGTLATTKKHTDTHYHYYHQHSYHTTIPSHTNTSRYCTNRILTINEYKKSRIHIGTRTVNRRQPRQAQPRQQR